NIVRRKDVVGDFDVKNLDAKSIQQLLLEQPKCLERPVLIHNGQAVIGRPPELILEFLQNQ
ncbi:MAG: ArsC/Spx/MgsR family protein, partial [Candidatus Poseidoniaceae archaeon]|nr:ArsC/Spx/MgsR family protein [Candidatus Poseidoniaceae archaeon]